MIEPFFGGMTGSPMWSGTPPGFGFVPTPLGIGSFQGAEGFGPQNIPQAPMAGLPAVGPGLQFTGAAPGVPHPGYGLSHGYALGSGFIPPLQPGSVFGQPGPPPGPGTGPFLGSGGYGALGGFEVPPGITAPALVAAIALRRGQPQGPVNDQEIEEFIYDALELLPGTNDVEVRVESGRVTLTGGVQQKRLKRDVGEIAWAIPTVNDVINNVSIATKRRSRAGREAESQQPGGGRKQA